MSHSRWNLRRTRSGSRPRPLKECTVVCVGFVFCSPCKSGTRDTWISAKLSRPTRNWNWRMASTKGADSMSPTVPPSYNAHRERQGGEMKGISSRICIYLDNADVRLFTRVIYRYFGNAFYPILNWICYMGNNLRNVVLASWLSGSTGKNFFRAG